MIPEKWELICIRPIQQRRHELLEALLDYHRRLIEATDPDDIFELAGEVCDVYEELLDLIESKGPSQ